MFYCTSTSLHSTMVPQLPLELIYHILSLIPASPSAERATALRACSLVNQDWRVIAQEELTRHINWSQMWSTRVDLFLSSPSARGGWKAESVSLDQATTRDLDRLLGSATSIDHLALSGSGCPIKSRHVLQTSLLNPFGQSTARLPIPFLC